MAIAKLLGFYLCPRLRARKDRHLFLPHGSDYPEILRSICHASIDLAKIATQWEQIVHLVACAHSGHTSAIQVLARFSAAARGDPLYEAMARLGRLLRTVFLADYFVNEAFRRELLRVLNRGESVNSLKRSIYVGRVASYQAKQHDEMQSVADALSLLGNLVMAWNTMKMQMVLDRWNTRRSTAVPPELIGRIAPTHARRSSNCAPYSAFPSSNTLNICCRHWWQQNHGVWVLEETKKNAPRNLSFAPNRGAH
jgi:TnpA family transposase